jgi:hypothetical protein
VQRPLIFSRRFLLIDIACFGLTGHHQEESSSQQPEHLVMATLAETCSDNKEKTTREYLPTLHIDSKKAGCEERTVTV